MEHREHFTFYYFMKVVMNMTGTTRLKQGGTEQQNVGKVSAAKENSWRNIA